VCIATFINLHRVSHKQIVTWLHSR